ncbi:IS3 family transposase [Bacteroides sp.]|uniref:IS3 family transposase n=3 Tax=Bacteria TaxID=2 RepID=UPI003A8EA25D
MSRSRRNFSAEFKTNLVLQLLKGEKELNVLAVENDIQPNLLRNWKKEFLANASLAFDNKREDNLREKLAVERKEKAEYAKKVGQLTMQVGRRKAGRYMREMDITPIYPKMNLSKRMKQAKVCPYLLRNAVIDRPNQAWSIDITYLPMKHGFLYLTAIIDWYSRCIVGWDVDDTMVINACKKAFKVAKPLIINSDQGSQFTSDKYIDFIRNSGIRQSMDGKSRWADNIMIERWFRSFKYEEAYLTEYANLKEAREAIGRYIYTYNFERCHQSIGNKRPAEVYYSVMLLDAARAAA